LLQTVDLTEEITIKSHHDSHGRISFLKTAGNEHVAPQGPDNRAQMDTACLKYWPGPAFWKTGLQSFS
jgi:hypothetical protein